MMRAPLAAVLSLSLAGCLAGDGTGGTPSAAPRSVGFYQGEVVVTGPPGYCVDPGSIQRRAAGGFALLAGCGQLSDAPAGQVPPAVITLSILPRDTGAVLPTAAQLAAPWADVGVRQQIDSDGISLIQVEKGGNSLLPEGDPRHWRGAVLIAGHLVGLAVYGETGAQAAGEAGKVLALDTARAIRRASIANAPEG